MQEDIYLATTHAIFSGPAVERLKKPILKKLLLQIHPIPQHKEMDNLKILSTANLLAEVIKRNIEHESISTLFN